MNKIVFCIFVCSSFVAAAQTPDRGTDLVGVTVKLTAGPKGAWLPNHFGDFDETCRSGFSADIVTLDGKRASNTSKSCAGSWLFGEFIPSEELKRYIYLKHGESRSWHTTLTQITHTPGTYEIEAEFLAGEDSIEQVAALPEVHGLMVTGHVPAKPVRVRIR